MLRPSNTRCAIVCALIITGCGGDDPAIPDAGEAISDASVAGTDVTLTYADHTETLERAWLGYQRTGGEITGLYFELSRGADDACPTESSPIPHQILTVAGYGISEPGTQTFADGVRVNFFDFEGAFFEEIAPEMATEASIVVSALDVTEGTARGTVELTFDDGTASGTFSATHCDSLDVEATK